MNLPDTRESLILRVRDSEDRDAWDQFSQIYRPVICRLAAKKGMQAADAEDLAQQVLVSVSRAIERWEPDAERAKFRTWLKRVTDNAILNALTRRIPDKTVGEEAVNALLQNKADASSPDSEMLQVEYRREIFHLAAAEIKSEFSEDTWQSFWLTAVNGMDIDDAAQELKRTRGSVYASRSRVMKRLKQKTEQLDTPET